MNNCILIKDFNFSIKPYEILEKLNFSQDENIRIVENLAKEGKKIAVPKAVFKECFICKRGDNFVVLDGIKFNSRVISINLNSENRAFPYIVTCGTELKQWCDSNNNKFEKKIAEFITQEILIQCHILLKNYIEKNFNIRNLARVNPGSTVDWDIKEQKNIFSILGDEISSTGVVLDSNFFMSPEKTYSGIYFHNETDYKNCYMCNAKVCPLRERNYDGSYYNKHFK